jgi:toxin ParE1/3/4
MLHIELKAAARKDLADAHSYYASRTPPLAEAFLDQFECALVMLVERPALGSTRFAHLTADGGLRVWRIDQFPFQLIYRVVGSTFQVLRVLHERRRVGKKTFKVS